MLGIVSSRKIHTQKMHKILIRGKIIDQENPSVSIILGKYAYIVCSLH
jgi:hypothetical protein